jgi:hypothetical protein
VCWQPAASQQPKQSLDRALLERYTKIEFFRLGLEKVVREHELTDHMSFNDDRIYKDLMNEVLALHYSIRVINLSLITAAWITSSFPGRFWLLSRSCFSN